MRELPADFDEYLDSLVRPSSTEPDALLPPHLTDHPMEQPSQSTQQVQPPRRRRTERLVTANGSVIQFNPERFAPLERFLEAGRHFQQQQQQQQQQHIGSQQPQRNNGHLRNKLVFRLHCRYCQSGCCNRAMRAILLADTKVELYSTDIPPSTSSIVTGEEDRLTHGCHCRIRDSICRGCGNVIGYHVSQPCDRCLGARNNGHFWMFYSEVVDARERVDRLTGKAMVWAQLSPMAEEPEEGILIGGYELYNR